MTLIKSISGIRGTVGGRPGDNLTPLDIVKFVSAYATWLKTGAGKTRAKIVLGRDARISGEMYAKLVEATLSGLGHDVVNIGLATTPTTEIAVTAEQADGGIILTASHNPKQWNALKLLNNRGNSSLPRMVQKSFRWQSRSRLNMRKWTNWVRLPTRITRIIIFSTCWI